MKHHPYSKIWPLMDGEDFEQFKADIKANGLRVDVITYQNMILDGRNRDRACQETGVPVRYVDAGVKTDKEALKLVVSLNMQRRHMSLEERAVAAGKLANILHGHNARASDGSFRPRITESSIETSVISAKQNNHHAVSIIEAAKVFGVSVASVKRARAILDYGTAQDVEDVITGKTSLAKQCNNLRPKRELAKEAKLPKRAKPAQPSSGGKVLRLHNTPPMKALTREQIDPEFTGTPMEWVDKYGHVQTHTAEQYATQRFDDWVCNARALVKRWRDLPELGRDVDHNWLRSPSRRSVASLAESMEFLRPKLAELEALLATATAALAKKIPHQGPDRSACG